MAPSLQLDPPKKLRGRVNILTWLTAITALLSLAGYSHYLDAANHFSHPLSATHQAAISTVVLNVADDSIASHIQHVMAGSTLPSILGYLVQTYMPPSNDLLHQLTGLAWRQDESVLEFLNRGTAILTQLQQVSRVRNTTPLIHEEAFLALMLEKLPSRFIQGSMEEEYNTMSAEVESYIKHHFTPKLF